METFVSQGRYLAGQILIAMPGMPDPRFAKSVIYLCAHNENGAMGLVINRPLEAPTFPDLLEQLDIDEPGADIGTVLRFGGPVEQGRGFVLHSTDYERAGTTFVDANVALTATIDILRAIAEGHGPRNRLLALGYSGWGAGQLDQEMLANGWLHCTADEALLFDDDLHNKWERAMAKIGIDPRMLADDAGHA